MKVIGLIILKMTLKKDYSINKKISRQKLFEFLLFEILQGFKRK